MKNFIKKYKFLGLLVGVIILIPIFVLAYGTFDTGYRATVNQTTIVRYANSTGSLNQVGACVSNVGDSDYFIPTKTAT